MSPARPGAEAEHAAAYIAGQCRSLLADRYPTDEITVETRVWGDGNYAVTAFHTVWHDGEAFAREVVTYKSRTAETGGRDTFTRAVRYYFSGHHEEHYAYPLARITE